MLIIGAGGLGCPAAIYLAGAGIGRLGIVDFDTVVMLLETFLSLSSLQ